ncbi:extracellular solute-binding protein [Tessaracoccus sp. OS52]|uniref:ABC transporter substrate-binding protein n=1 Tax=Tessaracoccus sp. OS52 TaxID=2886691 RepID=UPI001D12CD3F|nr:extracellular solute-binding protein [Tessaracoccus sp. OS52]MCC2592016.1 extracellular solute-binding protein [Tessaracoccus sp. OS52]
MKVTKRVGIGAIAATIALAATACSAPAPATTDAPSEGEGKASVTLDWGFWNQGDAGNAMWEGIAADVTEAHPEITVKLTQPPFADYFTKLQSQLASNSAPCIVSMQSLRLPAFAEAMEPLDELMAAQGFTADDWNPAALKALQHDGTQYAIPYGLSTMALFYNKDAFAQAGVDEPEPGWSIEDFEDAARKITEATGKPAFGQSFSDLHMFSQLLAYNGTTPVAEDGSLALTEDSMSEAFNWYSGLATDEKVSLVPASSSDIPWGEQQFVAGNVAMAVDGTWNLATDAIDAGFPVGVTTLPVGDGGISSFSANSGFGIAKSCEDKEAAAKAIAVITGAEGQEAAAEAGTMPARTASDDTFYEALATEIDTENPGYSEQARAVVEHSSETAIPFIPTQNWDAVTKSIAREFILAYTGSGTPDQALENVQAAAGN